MNTEAKLEFKRWISEAENAGIREELKRMQAGGNEEEISEAFSGNLQFGTAGLRAVMGAGSARMNIYTVAKASKGLADYINSGEAGESRKVAVGYDSRNNSELFAKTASAVLAANGLQVFIYPSLMPVPCVSFAVRELGCAAGVMITASHNPAKYNGYKVYGSDGCQITSRAAELITEAIDRADCFDSLKGADFDSLAASGRISYTGRDVYESFISHVMSRSQLAPCELIDRNVDIVYTPLNGAGLVPVTDVLRRSGFTNITVVPEQEKPDGNFPTCPFPNPEIREAMDLGLKKAEELGADLLLATDPDCDRVGIAVRRDDGEYVLLSGNETGILLLDYICRMKLRNHTMPNDPVLVKTVVTSDMADRVAEYYGVRTVNVLTGFKYIGEQIALLEKAGHPESFLLGFEESYGYLSGTYVRDKDGVNAAFLICEMFAYYKTRGMTLWERLGQLYDKFGYSLSTLYSFYFDGGSGMDRMRNIMKELRTVSGKIGGKKITAVRDYLQGLDGLPKSDVIKFMLEDGCSAVVRPSGTEPKVKLYLTVSAKDRETAGKTEKKIKDALAKYFA